MPRTKKTAAVQPVTPEQPPVESPPEAIPAPPETAPADLAVDGAALIEQAGEMSEAPPAPADEIAQEEIPPAEEPVSEPTPPEEAAPAASEQDTGSPESVRVGQVEGLCHRIELEVVLTILGEEAKDRIGALLDTPAILNQQDQVRATEGRCAPPIFTVAEGDKKPRLFHGIETIAAAVGSGLEFMHVVTIPSTDAPAVQSYLVGRHREQRSAVQDSNVNKALGLYTS